MPKFSFINSDKGVDANQHPLTVSNSEETTDDLIKKSLKNLKNIQEGSSDGLEGIINKGIVGSGMTVEEAEKYRKYDVVPTGFRTEEELNRERAENQARIEQFGNMLGQAIVNEVLIGTVRGFSDLYDSVRNLFDSEDNDYTNALSKTLEEWQNKVREALPIYQEQNDGGFHMGDFGWWMNGAVNAATTVSLMLPGLGVSKGLSALGKVGRIGSKTGKITRKALKAAGVEKVGKTYKAIEEGSKIGTMALVSRTAENYQEARETYKNVYDKSLSEIAQMSADEKSLFVSRNNFEGLSDEEMAEKIASVSAGQTFRNDYWMLLMDIPQFKTLSSVFKGAGIMSKATTRGIRKANAEAIEKLVGKKVAQETAEKASKTFAQRFGSKFTLENLGKGFKNVWKSTGGLMLGEGVEEGFQGIQSQRGEEYGELYFNPYLQRKTLGQYLQDESIWEQAFWGVMGGLLFQGAATGIRNLGNKIDAKIKKDKLTDTELKALLAGENKSRIEEIYGRFKVMDDLKEKMNIINQGYNPYSPVKDKKGQDVLVNGERTYEKIKSVDEAARLKSSVFDDFLTEFTLNAADNGNYELLKEFVSNKEFAEYFKDSGVNQDELLEDQFVRKMDEVYNQYTKAYYDIIDNTDTYNEYLTRLAARDITRKRLDIQEIDSRIENLNSILEEQNLQDLDRYEKIALQRVINAKLNEIDNAINKLNNNFKDKDTFYSKQAYNREIKQLQELKDSLYKQLETTDSNFNYSAYTESDLDKRFSAIRDLYNSVIGQVISDNTPFEKLSETAQKSLYAKANYQVYKQELIDDLPQSNNTKDFYKKLYDEKEAMFIEIAESKFRSAYDKIYDYIKKSENPEEAFQHLIKDDLNEDNKLSDRQKRILNDALEVLSIGAANRGAFNNAIAFMLTGEIAKRKKDIDDSKTVIIDDKKLNEKESKATTEPIKKNDSSTGETKKKNKNTTKTNSKNSEKETIGDIDLNGEDGTLRDDIVIYPDEEDLSSFDPIVNEVVALEQQQIYTGDNFPLIAAENAAEAIIKNNNSLWKNVIKDGVNSKSYQDFINLVKEEMIVGQGTSPATADAYAEKGVKMYLTLAQSLDKKYNFTKNEQKLFDDISKVLGVDPTTGNSMYEGLSEQDAKSRKDASIVEVFEYFVKNNSLITIDNSNKKLVNLKTVFKELAKLYDDKGISYDNLLYLYKDISNFVNTYRGNEYVFLNKDFLSDNFVNFVNNLYNAKTEVIVSSPFMHFHWSTKLKLINNGQGNYKQQKERLINLIKEARDKNVKVNIVQNSLGEDVSIGFSYKGEELGYISLVKASKDNNELTSTYEGIPIALKKNNDGTIESSYDYIFDEIFNNKDLYDELSKWFIRNNEGLFLTNDIASIISSLSSQSSNEKLDTLLKNEKVKKYIEEQKINIDGLTSRQIFNEVAKKISSILFYDMKSKRLSQGDKIENIKDISYIKSSFNNFKIKNWDNFIQTRSLYDRIKKDGEVTAILKSDNVGTIKFDHNRDKNINRLGISGKEEEHPFVFFDESAGIDENGKIYAPIPGIKNGSGILLGENQGINIIENGTISNTSGANIALIINGNSLNSKTSKLAGELRDATKEYILETIKDYYKNVAAAKTFADKEKVYNKLYEQLNSLFGNTYSKLFDNVFIAKGKDVITILTSENGENKVIAKIFKYKRLSFDKVAGTRVNNEGKVIEGEELTNYFTGAFAFKIDNEDTNKIFGINTKEKLESIEKFVDYMLDLSKFNQTFFAKKTNKESNFDGKHISKKNNKIIVNVGKFNKEFNNFTEMALKLNMFKTSQIGNSNDRYEYDNLPSSFFLQISDTIAPKTEEEKIKDIGLLNWIKTNDISPEDDVETFEVLEEFVPDNVLESFRDFNSYLKKNTSHSLFSNTIQLNVSLTNGAYAHYGNGKIQIGENGVQIITNRGWQPLIRLLLHENVHRLVDEQKFFDGEIGQKRLKDIRETFDIFWNTLIDDNSSEAKKLKQKYNKFYKDLVDREDANNVDICNEWIAEVLSDTTLRNYLNTIEVSEEIKANVTVKKSLLQRILEFVSKLFNISGKIEDNSLLAKINEVFSDVDVADENSATIIEKEVNEQQISSPVKGEENETDEEDDDPFGNIDYSNLSGDSKYENLTTDEIVLDDYNKDNSINVFGVADAPSINNFIMKKQHKERADLVSAINDNELKYMCS